MAIQTVLSSNTFNQFRVTTNQVIANVNSQFDGTANVVLNSANSAFANIHNLTVYGDAAIQGGDITTNNLTFTLANTTATTLQLGGAANVLIGSTAGNTTIRSANTVLTGDLHVNGGDILSTSTTLNIANTTATTLSVGGAATSLLLGATTGTATIRNATTVIAGDLTVSGGDIVGTATLNLANVTTTTLNIGGAATTLNMGANTGNTTIRSGNTIVFGDMWVNGGELRSTNTTFNLANSLPTTLGIGGSANLILIGATTGTTTIRNANVVLDGDLAVKGGDITTSSSTFNVANATATTVSVGGAATALLLGANTGTATIRNAATVLSGTLSSFGKADVCTGGTGDALFVGNTGGRVIVNAGDANNSIKAENANGTISIYGGNQTSNGITVAANGSVSINSTLVSTTTTTGALRVAGGLGVVGNTHIGGNLAVNGSNVTTTNTTFSIANTTATTMSVGGAATALLLGATTGTATIRNASTVIAGDLTVSGGDIVGTASLNLANVTTTTLNIGGAANVNIGSTAGNTTIRSANTVLTGDLHVSANAFIGSTTGNTTIRSANTVLTGDLFVNGGDIFTTNTIFSIANNTATTVWLGGGATSNVIVGATTGNTTLRSADTTVDGKLTVKGITNIGVNTSTDAVRITQEGSGNALVIQDESSDSSPIVVDQLGRLIMGGTSVQTSWYTSSRTPSHFITGNGANGDGLGIMTYASVPIILMGRHGANTLNTRGTVSNGDVLGSIDFAGDDGINAGLPKGAVLQVFVDKAVDTPNTTTIPSTFQIRTKTANVSTPGITASFDSDGITTLTGNLAVNGNVLSTSNTQFAIANTGATTVSVGGAATSLLIGATTGTTTIRNASTVVTGDLTVSGGDIIGTASLNLANVTSTTLNIGGAATTLNIGATTGNTTIRNAGTVIAGDLFVRGGDIVATTATANLANSTTTTLNIGGAANVITIGANTGTLTINNNKVVVNSTGALRVPVGNTAQRGTASQGEVRYNTQLTAYEGYDGTNWSSLGGVKSVDGLTYIIAESSPGNSDDTLHFYTANGATSFEVAQLDATKLSLLQTTVSSNSSTGALVVSGGVGIGGRLNVDGPVSVSASLTVTGNTVIGGGGLTTTNSIFTVANTNATLLELGGAANVNIGSTAGNTTIRSANTIITGNTIIGGNLTVNGNTTIINSTTLSIDDKNIILADGAANNAAANGAGITIAGSNANVVYLSASDSFSLNKNVIAELDLAVNGGDITTTSTTFNVANATATTLSVGGAATALLLGATTGTATIRNASTVVVGDLNVNGGDINTTATTFTVANTTATTMSVGGAATALLLGATTGTATIRNASTVVTGDLNVNGGDINTTSSNFAIGNTSTTSLWLGAGVTSNVLIGSISATTFIRSANTIVNGNFTANGTITETANGQQWLVASQYDIGMNPNQIPLNQYLGSMAFQSADGISVGAATVSADLSVNSGNVITTSTTFNVANTTATSVSVGGAANVLIGSTTGNTNIRSANTVLSGELFVNGGDIFTTASTFTVANNTATSVSLGGSANVLIGSTTGNTTIRSANTVLTGDLFVNGGDIFTTATTFTVANTTATSVSLGGAANVLIGSTTGNTTIRSGNTIVFGDMWVNGGELRSTNTTFNLANSLPTTLGIGGAANVILIGATTGTTTIRNATVNLLGSALTGPATFALANTTSTTLSVGGAATALLLGATTGTATIRNASTVLVGDLAVNGGDITTSATTFNVANATATTMSVGGAATALLLGATTGTATIRNASTVITGDLTVSGGDIVGTASLNLANTTTTALELGGAATTLNMGAATGTATIRNATVNLLGSALTTPATFALANSVTTSLEVGGAATTLNMGAATGTANIRNATVNLLGSALTGPATFSVANTTSTTLGIGGAATNLVIGATTGTVTLRNANVVVAGTLSARYATKVANTATATSLTPDVSAYNQFSYTALASALTVNAPIGTPTDGERLLFRIKDNGTSRAITWNAIYRIVGTVLPVATVANKISYVGCIYNEADTKWDVVAVSREA